MNVYIYINIYICQIILCTLNLHSVISQLYHNKAGKKFEVLHKKDHSITYTFAKGWNLSLFKVLDPANLQEIPRIKEQVKLCHESAIGKIYIVGSSTGQWVLFSSVDKSEGKEWRGNLWLKELKAISNLRKKGHNLTIVSGWTPWGINI